MEIILPVEICAEIIKHFTNKLFRETCFSNLPVEILVVYILSGRNGFRGTFELLRNRCVSTNWCMAIDGLVSKDNVTKILSYPRVDHLHPWVMGYPQNLGLLQFTREQNKFFVDLITTFNNLEILWSLQRSAEQPQLIRTFTFCYQQPRRHGASTLARYLSLFLSISVWAFRVVHFTTSNLEEEKFKVELEKMLDSAISIIATSGNSPIEITTHGGDYVQGYTYYSSINFSFPARLIIIVDGTENAFDSVKRMYTDRARLGDVLIFIHMMSGA